MAEADLIDIRRKKLDELESSGVDPYPRRFEVETTVATLRGLYESWDEERLQEEEPRARLAGRIGAKRAILLTLVVYAIVAGSAYHMRTTFWYLPR